MEEEEEEEAAAAQAAEPKKAALPKRSARGVQARVPQSKRSEVIQDQTGL